MPFSKKTCDQAFLDAWFSSFQRQYSEFTLRFANLDAVSDILHLERYCFNPFIAFGRRRWRYLIDQSSCITVLLYQHQQLVGYLCLFPHSRWLGLEIRALAVHWHFRRKGLAQLLLQLSTEVAHQLKYQSLYLSVDCLNEPGLQLYQRAGFKPHRRDPDYYGLGRDAYRMRADIPQHHSFEY